MRRVGVIGAAGFAGIQLVQILVNHPQFDLCAIASDSLAGTSLGEHYPSFAGTTDLAFCTTDEALLAQLDVVFLAVPHTASLELTPRCVERGTLVVDLSADFRLRNPQVYEQWYGVPHSQMELLASSAFGLPELFPDQLENAKIHFANNLPTVIACAGCYPTATSLAAAPAIRAGLLKEGAIVVADAISGVTGAGKKATENTHFCFTNENVKAYGVTTHRHTPEIEQILDVPGRLVFTPHLAPLNRGLLSTVTIPVPDSASVTSTAEAWELYDSFYASAPFVTVLPEGTQPRTASVAGTNKAHIGVAFDQRTCALVVTSAIDNLGKGAAGQAVQCANVVLDLPETLGLETLALPV